MSATEAFVALAVRAIDLVDDPAKLKAIVEPLIKNVTDRKLFDFEPKKKGEEQLKYVKL